MSDCSLARPTFARELACHAVAQEDSYQGRCTVSGALPPWLRGKLFRAGPGLWEVGERQMRHMLDGE